ncbi:phage major capsid protein, HK97 family [Nitratireductor aquibiodomus]|uniref:Phage major capsid protein, HK97 family n=1 Tax=Nitratireductor aquibiodomus TaxID=204799 RepID=A0A1H4JBQ6_9HYPH|nr:phage major capsid protein [Nitratireductor aquibiodomus]SEB43495.1 phage major capsid protein, HK97 family [Nitratireductor aquibiodomus]
MNAHTSLETRSALPLEIRNDPSETNDPLAAATAAVEELRSASAEFRTRQEEELRAANDRIAALETRLNRPGTGQQENREEPALERRAFSNFARYGVERMQADEVRALTVSTDTAGGYLAPEQFVQELDRNLVLFSPVRSVARVTPASAGEIILPKRTGTMTASWGGETDPATGTQPAYGQQKVNVYELKCYVDVSNTLLEDAAFNLEAELAFDFAEEFGRAEGAAFINGDGTGKPNGLLNTAGIDTLDTTGADLRADDLIDVFHDLPGAYAARAVWGMNRSVIGEVRKLKNSAGDYLWQDALTAGNPPTILGRPVVELPDMPDYPATDAEALPIVFGDFKSAFRIFDRVNLSVLRDPYSQQVNGLVRFHARRRVGGGVTKTEALRLLKVDRTTP